MLNYVQQHSIVEHNLNTPDSVPRPLVKLGFNPNTLSSLSIDGTDDTLLAAGGQDAEIHLSYHRPASAQHRQSSVAWQTEYSMVGSINNSVLLTSMSLTRSNESSVEPRLGISNNDATVKFYDVPMRGQSKQNLNEIGSVQLSVPINYSSISPDGRTLLSVGDSSKVYLHRMTGGARITFSPIATLKLPSPTNLQNFISASLMASFSSAFSSDGSKFAVASQEGLVAVWDVRSSKPMKIFQTEKTRMPTNNGGASGWLDDNFDWAGGGFKAPGWSVRNVKFGGSGDKEVMTFTEHNSLFHVVDARTFETEEIVQVPAARERTTPVPIPAPASAQHLHGSPTPYRSSRPPLASHSHHTHVHTSSRVHSTSPPSTSNSRQSQAQFLRALGDTFRISSPYSPPSSISDSTWRALRMSDSTATVSNPEGDVEYNDILVIPPFGDPTIESDVQALLGSHGLRSRQSPSGAHEDDDPNTGSAHGDYEYTPRQTYMTVNSRRAHDDDIEVDELESDCASSRAPSRSSSPSPSSHMPTVMYPGRFASPENIRAARANEVQPTYVEELDIAGTCFDPSGKHIYVASTESVVEWSLRGAEKRWWAGGQWR
ncbi:hypothetical protein DXG01_012295 [Tephrocybe rancida]|nr:hypothetical protein DXG01_012295 [Tephrocybe rancida]